MGIAIVPVENDINMKQDSDTLNISIGISTCGSPLIEQVGELVLLKNMRIGKDFHWDRTIEALLPGKIELTGDPEFGLINTLPVEQYLRCVVGSEMNPASPIEFLKAHAVISRSWAIGKIKGNHDNGDHTKENSTTRIVAWEDTGDHHAFHVCADDHCQRYQGIQPLSDAAKEVLGATEGEILVSEGGELVDARFSKCCGGKTELFATCWQPRKEPCLESFLDPWCDLSALKPSRRAGILKTILKDYDLLNDGGHEWHTIVSSSLVEENLRIKFGRDIGKINSIEIISRGASGRADMIRISGENNQYLDIGKELMIRRLLAPTHLYSSWIEIGEPEKTETGLCWEIRGRGWGHGVGLCQIGAARMALDGYGYREILDFYYPGSLIINIGN